MPRCPLPSFPLGSFLSGLLAMLLLTPRITAGDDGVRFQPDAGYGDLVAPSLADFLPVDVAAADYIDAVPRPEDHLGHQVGRWHVRHDQLVSYMEAVAATSERVRSTETGRSHEGRKLVVLTITSEENHAHLDQILERHRALSEPGADVADADLEDLPAVVYLGYSVHGNEASGSNASMVVAYHLAAAQDDTTRELLDDLVVLLDPSLNPDGLARFAQWANMHRGRTAVGDPQHRAHREAWPNGRTNHYWFDLNRDWLLAQHPESQARLATFQTWRPNVLADFHEMGHEGFFFQPGIPSRTHPLTPARNQELTHALAAFHARALDRIGSIYYSQESFDDFYYGKGSTYPDVQGAVGILFEQASVRGHAMDYEGGTLTFPFAVRNQVAASFSTLEGAAAHRRDLLAFQRDAYAEAWQQAGDGGWLVADDDDPERLRLFVELLGRHGVEAHSLTREERADGMRFAPGHAVAIPARQRQAALVHAMFERRSQFTDDTFYDVSTWTLPLAYGLPHAAVGGFGDGLGDPLDPLDHAAPRPPVSAPGVDDAEAGSDATAGAVAYALPWNHYWTPRALAHLHRAGVRVRVAESAFRAQLSPRGAEPATRSFPRGTLVVHLGTQPGDEGALRGPDRAALTERLAGLASNHPGIEVVPLGSGLTGDGLDLGSPGMHLLQPPRVALVVGDGAAADVDTYMAGQIWHLLDHRFHLPVTLLDIHHLVQLDGAELGRYNRLILADGTWSFDEEQRDRLRRWVMEGGTLVALERGAAWALQEILAVEAKANGNGGSNHAALADPLGNPGDDRRAYDGFESESARHRISGAIFEVDLDLSHPMAFGYPRHRLPVFKTSARIFTKADNPYATVAAYTATPLLSGYASEENRERLAGTPALLAQRHGKGAVILFGFDPTFRAVWRGTEKLLLNAIFLADALERRQRPQD